MPGNAAQHNPTDTRASCNLVSSPVPDFTAEGLTAIDGEQ